MKCPKCGRFVKLKDFLYNKFTEGIKKVKAKCKKCGIVYPTDWCYEELDPNLPENWF